MLGPTIDYYLLRPFCHSRGRLTAEEVAAANRVPGTDDEMMSRFLGYFDGQLDLRGKKVLDVGSGTGEMVIQAAQLGAARAVGVDLMQRWVDFARRRLEKEPPEVRDRVEFVCSDVHAWDTAERFDVIVSRTAFEHIRDPGPILQRFAELLAPGGVFAAIWEPFHGPFGDHMNGFFKVQIPYRGVLFNEKALLRLRSEFFRPGDPVERFRDIDIGLNQLRYSEFVRLCEQTGLEVVMQRPNATPANRRWLRPLMRVSDALGKVPVVRDYIAAAPVVLLQRPLREPARR